MATSIMTIDDVEHMREEFPFAGRFRQLNDDQVIDVFAGKDYIIHTARLWGWSDLVVRRDAKALIDAYHGLGTQKAVII